jgi:hypothetical protein
MQIETNKGNLWKFALKTYWRNASGAMAPELSTKRTSRQVVMVGSLSAQRVRVMIATAAVEN